MGAYPAKGQPHRAAERPLQREEERGPVEPRLPEGSPLPLIKIYERLMKIDIALGGYGTGRLSSRTLWRVGRRPGGGEPPRARPAGAAPGPPAGGGGRP